MSSCIVCGKAFKAGDHLQAFLRSPDDPRGSWAKAVLVDKGYQSRVKIINDRVKRRHVECGG